ncbi:hypothetical protein ABFS82_09G052100 [Erythranthe guttata]|uniref:Protein NIM1-INTERACTING 2 n=1 Tax=Erythranthe guttata TaxID=4155 RepID=A0A022RZH9_ERYGU|nr:PREDICTED: protein NIM1-INTERACTING 2-like [Erythranthe guttata]EYU45449.1 hypothetical protein MIMGU_mgv1a016741mg [Erythranthe guttata]|eukprot:XP_012842875.1 PREDICTED: protein NIM1-INTERACTING 2-like [Erythranthe guttata]
MKEERKRKRAGKKVECSSKADDDRMRTRERESAAAVVVPSPTEEEVDEFFSILRRMRLAANYFHKGNFSTKDGGSNGRQDTPIAVDGSKSVAGTGLDLNAVPEAEINSL